jgi:hypothetical protein
MPLKNNLSQNLKEQSKNKNIFFLNFYGKDNDFALKKNIQLLFFLSLFSILAYIYVYMNIYIYISIYKQVVKSPEYSIFERKINKNV